MSPLRQRMIQDMQLRGFSARTQECYVAAVRQLAEHYHTRPDQLTEEHLRQYFLYLANEKKVARATATIALCGIKFFYERTLERHWTTLEFIRPAREKKLPVVLSRDEVRRILHQVRIPVYRAVAHASLPAVVVPRTHPSRSAAQPGPQRRPGHPQPAAAGRVPSAGL